MIKNQTIDEARKRDQELLGGVAIQKLLGKSQQDAIDAAIDCAYAMGDIGIDAQVLVQEADKEQRTEWSYSLDFLQMR